MTPFELVQWSIAVLFSLILVGIGIGVSLTLVGGAIKTLRKPAPGTVVNVHNTVDK